MFLVLAKKKLELCCAVSSMGTEIGVRNEAAPAFPLPHGAAVCRRLSWRSLVLEELWNPVLPKLCPAVLFSVVSIDFSCRCNGRSKELQGSSSLPDIFVTQLLRRQRSQFFWHYYGQFSNHFLQKLPITYTSVSAVFAMFQMTSWAKYLCSLHLFWHNVSLGHQWKSWVREFKLWKHHEHHHDTCAPRILLVMKIYRCWSNQNWHS